MYYNPYGGYYPSPPNQMQMYQTNNLSHALPQQQITQVSGKASVDTIQLAPNSSLLAMDTTAPIVWMCVSDGVGKVTSTPFDITVHQDKPSVNVDDIARRMDNVEKTLFEMEAKLNAQSDVGNSKPKQDTTKYYPNKANDKNA